MFDELFKQDAAPVRAGEPHRVTILEFREDEPVTPSDVAAIVALVAASGIADTVAEQNIRLHESGPARPRQHAA
jgi:hypothetical protein